MTCTRCKKTRRVGDDGLCQYCAAKAERDGHGMVPKIIPVNDFMTTLGGFVDEVYWGRPSHYGKILLDHDAALRELVKEAKEMIERQDNVVIDDEAGNPSYEMCFVCEQRSFLLKSNLVHSVDCPRAAWIAKADEVTR